MFDYNVFDEDESCIYDSNTLVSIFLKGYINSQACFGSIIHNLGIWFVTP